MNKLNKNSDEYLFNLLKVENFRSDSPSRLRHYFSFIRNNALKLDGDIWEFGVFQGASLCATALILKELGSDKKIYGLDSFSGFPSYHKNDSLDQFRLRSPKTFSAVIRDKAEQSHTIISGQAKKASQAHNISSSGAFDDTSFDLVQKKLDEYGLDNVTLIKGPFEETIPKINANKVFAVNIDCDLYSGYQTALPFCWENLLKGGFIHLDEYYSLKFPGAKIAVDEFCVKNKIMPTKLSHRLGEFERWALIK